VHNMHRKESGSWAVHGILMGRYIEHMGKSFGQSVMWRPSIEGQFFSPAREQEGFGHGLSAHLRQVAAITFMPTLQFCTDNVIRY